MRKIYILLAICLFAKISFAQTTVFSDDFSTNQSTIYTTSGPIGASAWTVLSGGTAGQDFGARRNTSPAQLELTNDATAAANVNGWVLSYTLSSSFLSPYNTTLNLNGTVTWIFNMRQIRTDPAGLSSGTYGVAFVLAGTSTTTSTAGTGYAVALGQSGATDPIRLIRYSAGLATSTNIITSNTSGLTDFGTEYLSIKVTYTASSNTWELFLRNDGASAFADPASGSLTSQGTAVDATYTGSSLTYMGGYWSGSTAANQTAFFDNVSVFATAPPSNSITTGTVSTPPFCVDGSSSAPGTVAYTSTGTYSGSTFTAYLSDAAGSFASPVNIGTASVTGTDPSGSISISIPAGTASGTGYRIRIDSDIPAVTGSQSSAFQVINGVLNVTSPAAAGGSGQSSISWTNPTGCYNEILIVAAAGAPNSGTPTGDGTAYTGNLTFGNGTALGNGFVVYKGNTSPQVVTGLVNGTNYYFKFFTRYGTSWSPGVEVNVTPADLPVPGEILINQMSPDYNGASDEYVELVNTTNKTFDLSTLAIRYQSSSGSSGGAGGNLTGLLQPHHYWLLSPNASITVGMTVGLTADGNITAGFAAASGQIALVRISDNAIIDGVGYGTLTGGTYYETSPAPAPPADGGIKRTIDGVDTDNNAADFSTVANASIFLRNSSSAPLPVIFSGVRAFELGNQVKIEWTNLAENNVNNYTIERSADGRNFNSIASVNATGNTGGAISYDHIDLAPLPGINFYRIRANEYGGLLKYSLIVKLDRRKGETGMLIYPNPVLNKQFSLQLSALPKGDYAIRIFSTTGALIQQRSFRHEGGAITEVFELPANTARGNYRLQLSGNGIKLHRSFVNQ